MIDVLNPKRSLNQAITTPSPGNGHHPSGAILLPPPSPAAKPIWQRLVQNPTTTIDRKEANQIHTLIRRGIDPYRFGHTRIRIDMQDGELITQKAAWRCTTETYNKNYLNYGKRQKTYTRKLHTEHLSGASDDFFCGAAPSTSESGWQWALLDLDNRGEDFQQLTEIIKDAFPELHFQPSTSGKGLHGVIRISHHHPKWHFKIDDPDMHNQIIQWSGRLKQASQHLSSGPVASFCELKGACCYWNKSDETWTLGTLGRLPRLSFQQLRSIPIFRHGEVEKRIAKIEQQVGISSPPPPSVLKLPSVLQGVTTVEGVWDEDAWKRMIQANRLFIKQSKRLPETPEILCDFYEQSSLNTGDRTPERLNRAERVLAYARKDWIDSASRLHCDPSDLEDHIRSISKIASDSDLRSFRGKSSRVIITVRELAAYVLVASYLNESAGGFSSRDGIMKILNDWHQQGILPHIVNKHKMAQLRKAALSYRFLVMTRRPCHVAGIASSYVPGEAPAVPSSPPPPSVLKLPSVLQGVTNSRLRLPHQPPDWDDTTIEQTLSDIEKHNRYLRSEATADTEGNP